MKKTKKLAIGGIGMPAQPKNNLVPQAQMQKVDTSRPAGAIVPQRSAPLQARQRELNRTTVDASKLGPANPNLKSPINFNRPVASPIKGDVAGAFKQEVDMLNAQRGDAAAQKRLGLGIKKGGKVSSASKRGDGIAIKGKTKGRFL